MTQTRPRAPGVVEAAVFFAVVVLLASLALTHRSPPPPTIAEFAPQAVQHITESPEDQAFSKGAAAGAVAAKAADDVGARAATPAPIDVPRVRRCVGDPPRQIEDPQSPPCVPYWTGDNGGATSKGVTRDEVRVVAPQYSGEHELFARFFNTRFEFYGRQMHLLDMAGEVSGDAATQRAAADSADEEHNAFASLSGGGADNQSVFYYDELARRRVIGIEFDTTFNDEYLDGTAPYIWQYPMASNRQFAELGSWACARLTGKSAAHAGPVLRSTPREFGIVLMVPHTDFPMDAKPLEQTLERCGAKPKVVLRSDAYIGPTALNAIVQLRDAGVTSVFYLGLTVQGKFIGQAATNQAYFPEWLISSYIQQDLGFNQRTFGFPPEQREHLFGLSMLPRALAPPEIPPYWASKEADPAYTQSAGSQVDTYRNMLVLAAGIQLAGPRLTAETFRTGLQRAMFPNPNHPIMAGSVGFGSSSHTMTRDSAEIWWSEAARDPAPPAGGSGAFCYVAGGRRGRTGAWAAQPSDPFFTGPCDSGMR